MFAKFDYFSQEVHIANKSKHFPEVNKFSKNKTEKKTHTRKECAWVDMEKRTRVKHSSSPDETHNYGRKLTERQLNIIAGSSNA